MIKQIFRKFTSRASRVTNSLVLASNIPAGAQIIQIWTQIDPEFKVIENIEKIKTNQKIDTKEGEKDNNEQVLLVLKLGIDKNEFLEAWNADLPENQNIVLEAFEGPELQEKKAEYNNELEFKVYIANFSSETIKEAALELIGSVVKNPDFEFPVDTEGHSQGKRVDLKRSLVH